MEINQAKNILVIRLSSLGDVLLTTPLVRSIKKLHNDVSLDFIVQKEFFEVYQHNPSINNCFLYNKLERSLISIDAFQLAKYDLIIDLQNNRRSKEIYEEFSGNVLRFKKNSIKKFLLVNAKINLLEESVQIPERYAAAIKGIKLDSEGLEIFGITNKKILNNFEKNIIGICPGSRHFTKMWPIEYFKEISDILISNGFEVALLGGNDDREIVDKIIESNKQIIDFTTNNDLLKTADNIAQCRLLLCNDSGLMHLASAVQTPLIAIFGSTVREFGFTPYKCKNLVLENNSLSCRPCSHIGKSYCPKKHFKCMIEIKPQYVFEKIKEMLID